MADFRQTIPKIVEWLDRHPDGVDVTDLAAGLGLTYSHVAGAVIEACAQGLARWVHAPFGKAHNRRVYYSPRHCPAVWGEASLRTVKAKAKMGWKDVAKARMAYKSTEAPRAAGFATKGQPIITTGPAFVDRRYTPERVEPFFSAMTPGSYIRTGSSIERAYAKREQGGGTHAAG